MNALTVIAIVGLAGVGLYLVLTKKSAGGIGSTGAGLTQQQVAAGSGSTPPASSSPANGWTFGVAAVQAAGNVLGTWVNKK